MEPTDHSSQDELAELLLAETLDELTAANRSRLEQLVRDDPVARRRYLAYVRIESQLQWRFAKAPSGSQDRAVPEAARRSLPFPTLRRIGWAAAVAACIAIAMLWWPWGPWGSLSPPEIVETPRPPVVGPTAALVSGSRYAAAIRLAGWEILPTVGSEYEVAADGNLELTRGELYVAAAGPSEPAAAFQVRTPAGRVMARGTRYIVSSETTQQATEIQGKGVEMGSGKSVGYLTRVYVLAGMITLANVHGEIEAAAGENVKATGTSAPSKLKDEGNFKEAFDMYRKLVVDPKHGGKNAATDLLNALQCLQRLNREAEWDDLAAEIASSHGKDWRVLQALAQSYQRVYHGGSIVDNKFVRRNWRGRRVNTGQRDRLQSMLWMNQALPAAIKDKDKKAAYDFCKQFAAYFRQGREAWRLLYKTDLGKLPDYGIPAYHDQSGGAPVTAKGTPVYHAKPASWAASKSDGQRWRWLLGKMAALDPDRADDMRLIFADFLRGQFGVHTMGFTPKIDLEGDLEAGPFSVHTLADGETIARLATGVKRFKLPKEYDFVGIYKSIAANAPKPKPSPLSNVQYKLYKGKWDVLPEFEKLKAVGQGKIPSNYIDISAVKPHDGFAMVFTATLNVPADGEYTISLDSDDGSWLHVGDDFELAYNGLHGVGDPQTGKVKLRKGKVKVRVQFFENTGDEDLIIHWSGPGIKRQDWTISREASPSEHAMERLASVYQNRLQYAKAADQWRAAIKTFGTRRGRQAKLAQIIENWGRLEGVGTFSKGSPITLPYVFRNGEKLELTATPIKIETLLTDIKAYLKSNPKRMDRLKYDPNRIGRKLVYHNETKYLESKPAAEWAVKLAPRKSHWDKRIDVTVPVEKAGGYLVRAKMADGNTTRIIVWVTDTTIVSKRLHKQTLYFLADAKTGAIVPGVNLEFFGYWQQYIPSKQRVEKDRYYNIHTRQFAMTADERGMALPDPAEQNGKYTWLVIARDGKTGRFGMLGFNGVRHSDYRDANYQASKAYVFADRPVYRPDQKVHFKAWVRAARYDMAYVSHFAGRTFRVRINGPRGQKLLDKQLKANEYGAVTSTIELDENAALGNYNIIVTEKQHVDPFTNREHHERYLGSTRFRVEEYKKPEFEVAVEAPKDPVKLGDAFEATVKAKYYFGGAVTSGKVHYTVKRTERTTRWFPPRRWDWFYGAGYAWHGRECRWYPGWEDWGCRIWPGRGHNPPEVVADNTVDIGEDGTVKIKIDSALALARFGHLDHTYSITAEVTDESRRTIVGSGSVVAGRKPFSVHAWMSGGHYRVGDTMVAKFQARRPDGKPVTGSGTVTLYSVRFNKAGKPTEKAVQTWKVKTTDGGAVTQKLKATTAGQYRVACELTSAKGHVRTGATFAVVTGEGKLKGDFRFNDLELALDKSEYDPGDQVRLLLSANQPDSTVYLFTRPANGVYRLPEIIKLDGQSVTRTLTIEQRDMPNIYVEAVTIANGKVHAETKKIVVPPVKRVSTVSVEPSAKRYEPGKPAKVRIRLTDMNGKPFVGETVVSIYDKSIEYIAGGHPAGDIRAFFWKWQRHHHINQSHNLSRRFGLLFKKDEVGMSNIGVFGNIATMLGGGYGAGGYQVETATESRVGTALMPMAEMGSDRVAAKSPAMVVDSNSGAKDPGGAANLVSAPSAGGESPQVKVRKDFADSAYWTGSVITDADGTAEIELPMPENLTTWKIHAWSVGHGTVVGEGTAEVITSKDLLIRLQAPRFFVQSDEVTLSANVHSYLEGDRDVQVRLETGGGVLSLLKGQHASRTVTIPSGHDKRVDWRVRVNEPGEAVVRMFAVSGKATDAMEMKYPSYVHGMLKTDSYSASIRPSGKNAKLTVTVPEERQPEHTHLEVRYSPSIAVAMVDALPYLAGYEYKHSEAALSRFVPLAVTHKILKDMGVNLEAVKRKQTNLNPQEIGDPSKRAAQWKAGRTNPVFDNEEVLKLVRRGLRDLAALQNSDGGWGWCPKSKSGAHSTAYVVHGLQTAKVHGVAIVPGMLERGVKWLANYQKSEAQKLANAKIRKKLWKSTASNLDAFVAMVLADADQVNEPMLKYLYRDRTKLSVYALAMCGLTYDKLKRIEQRDMCLRNVKQYLVIIDENQTARLNLPSQNYWWRWYGSGMEAHAYFLKLLVRVEPKSDLAAGLAKYLLNNRKHATYWNNTRDTALSIEALAEYITATGEGKPDMTVEVLVDGKVAKKVRITAENLFTFDNVLEMRADRLSAGKHTVEVRRQGKGPVYVNAYMTNFTLEEFITKAGREIKVERRYYKLVRKDQKIQASGSRGQLAGYRVEHYDRVPLKSGATLKSGDLVEVELLLESLNDYEHLLFEDFKPAGLEAVSLRSGWVRNAYMELRDEKAAFLIRRLPVGRQTITYRLRAEIPGKFSALPTKGLGVYAPELRANSDEMKVKVIDK